MKIRWRYILLSLALTLLLGLACWYQAFFFTYLIEPIAGILWLVYRTFSSVDQEVYWALLILTALILILRMIANNTEGSYMPAYRHSIQEHDQVAYWETLLDSAEESEKDRLVLQHELESLHRSIGALAEGNEIGEIHLPPVKKGFRQRVHAAWKLSILFRIMPQRIHETTDLEKHVDIIVKSMETQLEIHHDGISNRTNED